MLCINWRYNVAINDRQQQWKPILTPIRVWIDLCMLAYRWHVWQDLKVEVVPVLFEGRAKQWYSRTLGSMQGDWEMLCSKFYLFPISRVVSLWIEVLTFKQKEKESLGASWECINSLITTGSDLAISDPMLLQHFYMSLNKDSAQSLDIASRRSFPFVCLLVK
jgi:hypothetical protein